jgi:hypothetical protein
MMVPLVGALAAVFLRQLDGTVLESVDGADVDAVRADDFHVLPDEARIDHRRCSSPSA